MWRWQFQSPVFMWLSLLRPQICWPASLVLHRPEGQVQLGLLESQKYAPRGNRHELHRYQLRWTGEPGYRAQLFLSKTLFFFCNHIFLLLLCQTHVLLINFNYYIQHGSSVFPPPPPQRNSDLCGLCPSEDVLKWMTGSWPGSTCSRTLWRNWTFLIVHASPQAAWLPWGISSNSIIQTFTV